MAAELQLVTDADRVRELEGELDRAHAYELERDAELEQLHARRLELERELEAATARIRALDTSATAGAKLSAQLSRELESASNTREWLASRAVLRIGLLTYWQTLNA